jgi:HAD superfamily hydrolase (TIGR01509 family)
MREKMKNKTYLFDFDGTLVNSMATFSSVMIRILDEHGIKYGDDIIKIITPLGYGGTAKYFRELGIDRTVEDLVATMNEYARPDYENVIPAKEGVIETLRALKERGESLNILTASPHIMLDPCLIRLGIYDLFDNVWSSDDFGTTKSNPEIYKMAAERLGVAVGEVIFVDDNVNAVRTAKTAGAVAYGIFDESSADSVEEMKEVSLRYLEKFEELLE